MHYFENAHNFRLEGNAYLDQSSHVYINATRSGFDRLEEVTLKEVFRDSSAREILRCFEGTRMAHRESIACWGKGEWRTMNTRVMWMDGPAGVGKSTVAQTWADELCNRLSAAIFLSRENGWNQAIKLIPTIAFQLATKYSSYRVAVEKAITRNPLILDAKSVDTQFQELIVRPILESDVEDQGAMEDTIIIIDGLDECGALSKAVNQFQAQAAVINIITTSATNHTTPFLWGIFSRPETHIINTFQSPQAISVTWRLTLPLKAPNVNQDIEAYFRCAFGTIRRKYSSIPSKWPSQKSLTQLVNQSDGLFIYATSATRYIERNIGTSRLGPQERLHLLLEPEEGKRAKLSKLDQLYLLIMDQIPRDILSDTLLILCAQDYMTKYAHTIHVRPTIPILSSLLDFSQPVFHDATSPLHSVLQEYIREGASHPSLRFFHASFTDFLTNVERSQRDYYIHATQNCTLFYSACVYILSRPRPLMVRRHPLYTDNYKDQEEKDIGVRQAALRILVSLPYFVDYFHLSEHPNILDQLTKIDWNLEARSYRISIRADIVAYFSRQIPVKWRSQIVKPKTWFYKIMFRAFGPPLGIIFVFGSGDKKALLLDNYLEPYQR
ncbi:hypothetical protein NP233_g2863 [Leucocoprinus birnbaumii]|uniref:Nephrocystin 3-like N-terminal domain-containing protein n=1 Tax=Leucocoprinus birnbaumii TaxID=56174 RepID=A0AAD5VZE1_9AGAR|nr:hypothetical protein NP233_g2863 [Leucocoprinus birnbaumii]